MSIEKRRHLRLPVSTRTFIELEAPDINGAEAGRLAACTSETVSRGGIQVVLDEELAVSSILQIGVDAPNEDTTFFLAGEVKWCRPCAEDEKKQEEPLTGWRVGFEILNSHNSDIERWVALLASLEE